MLETGPITSWAQICLQLRLLVWSLKVVYLCMSAPPRARILTLLFSASTVNHVKCMKTSNPPVQHLAQRTLQEVALCRHLQPQSPVPAHRRRRRRRRAALWLTRAECTQLPHCTLASSLYCPSTNNSQQTPHSLRLPTPYSSLPSRLLYCSLRLVVRSTTVTLPRTPRSPLQQERPSRPDRPTPNPPAASAAPAPPARRASCSPPPPPFPAPREVPRPTPMRPVSDRRPCRRGQDCRRRRRHRHRHRRHFRLRDRPGRHQSASPRRLSTRTASSIRLYCPAPPVHLRRKGPCRRPTQTLHRTAAMGSGPALLAVALAAAPARPRREGPRGCRDVPLPSGRWPPAGRGSTPGGRRRRGGRSGCCHGEGGRRRRRRRRTRISSGATECSQLAGRARPI
jgi:hypothetical protein